MLKAMLRYLLLCFGLTALVGCAGDSGPRTVNAAGVVTLDGNPVEKATVIFIDTSSSNPASGMTDSQGRFSLSLNGEKKGAIPGDYQVQVSKTLLEGNGNGGTEVSISHGLPKKYASVVTSGLTCNVPDSGKSDIKIELNSK